MSVQSTTTTATGERAGGAGLLRRLAPIAILGGVIALVFAFDLDRFLSFEALRDNRVFLMGFVEDRAILAVTLFVLIYAVSTATSLPGGAILSIAGGFLFGSWLGTVWIVAGATIGATALFLVAKSAFGDALKAKAGPWQKKMEAGFQDNAFSYLLVLRLVPLFPFFVVNLVPALLGVRLRTYLIATFVGIIPGSFVFASVGAGLGSVFDAIEDFSPAAALTPEVIAALVGLAILSLVPVAYKKLKTRRSG